MITMNQYRLACYLVDRYDAAQKLTDFMWKPGLQGRRPLLTPRAFLIGCLLTIIDRRTMLYTDVYETLVYRIPIQARLELGVWKGEKRADGATVARRVLQKSNLDAFTERLRRQCGGDKHGGRIQPEQKRALLDIVNSILRATHPSRPIGSASYAIDESGVWAWSRARKRTKGDAALNPDEYVEEDIVPDPETRRSVDRDANWGGKTSKGGGGEMYFGFSLHGVVRAPAEGASYDAEPLLLQALDLTPASTDLVDATLSMLDDIRANGVAVDEIIGDRHYSYKKPERWAHQLVKRGIRQVVDLHDKDHGFRDANGTRVAAGVPHCPATPDHLAKIPRPGPVSRGAKATRDRAEEQRLEQHRQAMGQFTEAINERKHYALERIGKSAANDVDSRYRCPALAGSVGCPLRPGTVLAAQKAGLPIVADPPELSAAPSVCTGKGGTVTLRFHDTQPKLHQKHYWGSDGWTESYGRRTHVESFFGTLKDAAVGNMHRGAFRGDCLGLKLLYVGLCCTITNVRRVHKWHERTGDRLDLADVLLAPVDHPDEVILDAPSADAA
jgi:hypothetical protein